MTEPYFAHFAEKSLHIPVAKPPLHQCSLAQPTFPQGLKPSSFCGICGTTEVVPFQCISLIGRFLSRICFVDAHLCFNGLGQGELGFGEVVHLLKIEPELRAVIEEAGQA